MFNEATDCVSNGLHAFVNTQTQQWDINDASSDILIQSYILLYARESCLQKCEGSQLSAVDRRVIRSLFILHIKQYLINDNFT